MFSGDIREGFERRIYSVADLNGAFKLLSAISIEIALS